MLIYMSSTHIAREMSKRDKCFSYQTKDFETTNAEDTKNCPNVERLFVACDLPPRGIPLRGSTNLFADSAEFPADVVRAVFQRPHSDDAHARRQVQRADTDLDRKLVFQFQLESRAQTDAVKRHVVDQHLPAGLFGIVGGAKLPNRDDRLAMASPAVLGLGRKSPFSDNSFLKHSHDLNIQYRFTPVQTEPLSYSLSFG